MAFDNVQFPQTLAALSAEPAWSTTVIQTGGGAEQRSVLWSDTRRHFNAISPTLTKTQLVAIEKHFNARRGRGRAFPLRDRTFFQVTTPEAFGTGDGVTVAFQLKINYGDSGNAFNKNIYLPESGTIAVFDNAVQVTEGAGPGKFTLAYSGATGGTVTFGTAPISGHALTWTGAFFLPARYDTDQFPAAELFVWRTDDTGLVKGPTLPIIEIRYPTEFP